MRLLILFILYTSYKYASTETTTEMSALDKQKLVERVLQLGEELKAEFARHQYVKKETKAPESGDQNHPEEVEPTVVEVRGASKRRTMVLEDPNISAPAEPEGMIRGGTGNTGPTAKRQRVQSSESDSPVAGRSDVVSISANWDESKERKLERYQALVKQLRSEREKSRNGLSTPGWGQMERRLLADVKTIINALKAERDSFRRGTSETNEVRSGSALSTDDHEDDIRALEAERQRLLQELAREESSQDTERVHSGAEICDNTQYQESGDLSPSLLRAIISPSAMYYERSIVYMDNPGTERGANREFESQESDTVCDVALRVIRRLSENNRQFSQGSACWRSSNSESSM